MIITYQGGSSFSIKAKNKSVKIGEKVALGDLKIDSPGEYESEGVEVDLIDGKIEVCAERLTVAWIKKGKPLSDDELERLNGVNILLMGTGGGEFTDTKTALDIVRQIEPQIVIPMYKDSPDEFLKAEGSHTEALPQLKITYPELPPEETKTIILSPAS